MQITSQSYAEHERSTYANANGCADHDTNAECRAYASGYTSGYADAGTHEHDTSCEGCESIFDAGYGDGEREGHCCNHG